MTNKTPFELDLEGKEIKDIEHEAWDYDTILTAKRKDDARIKKEFDKLWSCLKFEKNGSKVIGYTFDKREVDEFKQIIESRLK